MAPTPHDTAIAILRTLVKRLKLRPGQSALLKAVLQNAEAEGVDRQDFEAGLNHAASNAWIVHDFSSQTVRLTQAGFAAV
jgi:hypothetical protein